MRKRNYYAYFESRKAIGDYPLAPYLDYQFANQSLYPLDKIVVEKFIRQYEGSYLGERMHRRYLHVLAKSESWSDLVYWYSPEVANKEITCSWLEGRFAQGDKTALEKVSELWMVAKSQPAACDSLFNAWFKSEYYSDQIAWKRFLLAIENGQRGLGRYIASSLTDQYYQEYIKLIWELDQRPHRIKNMSRYRRHTPEMQQVVAFGIQKYAKRHPVKALNQWEQYEASAIFDESLTRNIKYSLANQLLKVKEMAQVRTMLLSSPSIRKPKVIERLLRAQLREKDWSALIETIELLPQEKQNSDRWRYWQTRAGLELAQISSDEANSALAELATNRSFYGFLAADMINSHYALEDKPLSLAPNILESLEQRPEFRRAKELWLVGHLSEAQAEWYYGLDKLSARELAAAGALAHSWGWYDRGIQAMIAGKHWDHLNIRFPLAYKDQILDAADKTALAPAFIFAVARQESAMFEQAKSSAGARGLMQLMPATAMETAKKKGIQHSLEDLYKADHNISLGSQYLDELVDKFDGNRILAAAAYNAGPHRVDRWTQDQIDLDFDIWIETIPFKETRGYVQNVLTYAVIYSFRMGVPAEFVTKSEANQKL